MQSSPTLADGRVPVLMELLSPAGRPLQVNTTRHTPHMATRSSTVCPSNGTTHINPTGTWHSGVFPVSNSCIPVWAGTIGLQQNLQDDPRQSVHLQVTTDLAGFWKSSYSLVRRDMKGRYPRHYWPEDPSQAEPTRLTKKGMEREAEAAAAVAAAATATEKGKTGSQSGKASGKKR